MRLRLIAFVGALAALGVVYAIGWLSCSSTGASLAQGAPGTGQVTAVTSVIRACPPAAPREGQTGIAVAAVPNAGDLTGTATLSAVGTTPGRTETVSVPRAAELVKAPLASAATEVSAAGAMAEGLAAERTNAAGITQVRCADPGSDLWFAGTGQGAGAADIRLYLTNTDDLPATVNVTLMTDAGMVQNDTFSGISVPPDQTVEESLTAAVRGSEVVSLDVQSSAGRVAAAVWEGTSGDSAGTWLPEATAPATTVVIPGLSSASSAARLFIVVPGMGNAQVKVTALTPHGRFLPFGSGPVSAPDSAASEFALSSLGAGAAAIELTSNVPITAAVLVPGTGLGAVTSAVAPVVQQAVVAGNPAGGYTTSMLLSAPAATARVAVSTIPASSVAEETVAAGHTVSVSVNVPKGARHTFAIVLTPLAGSGPVYAARAVTNGGTVASIIPVASAPTSVDLPPVRESYTAVLP